MSNEIVRRVPDLEAAAGLILAHEERFDGSGYPHGLKGREIPFAARLLAVIDALDAMSTERPYRKAGGFDEAKAEILRCAGRQFDPVAVEAFLAKEAVLRDMVERRCADASWAL